MNKLILFAAFAVFIPFALSYHEELSYAEVGFASSFLNRLMEKERGNIAVSPYSIYRVLLLLFFGSNGNTKQSLQRALNLDWIESDEILQQMYLTDKQEPEMRMIQNANGFSCADRIFFEKGSQLKYVFFRILNLILN